MLEEKQKALDLVLKEIEKQYGKGAIMKLGQAPIKHKPIGEPEPSLFGPAMPVVEIARSAFLSLKSPCAISAATSFETG